MIAGLAALVTSLAVASTAAAAVDLRSTPLGGPHIRPGALRVGDVTGDGAADIVMSARRCGRYLLVAAGRRPAVRSVSLGPGCPSLLGLADLDRDGTVDRITGEQGRLTVRYRGARGTRRTIETGGQTAAVASGDFNRDGRRDLAVADFELEPSPAGPPTAAIRVLLATGPRSFAPPLTVTSSGAGNVLGAGDLDGDGIVDLVSGGERLRIYRGNGDGTFRAPSSSGVGRPASIWIGRFDADRTRDLVVATDYRVWLVRGGRRLRAKRLGVRFGDYDLQVSAVQAGDLDVDGRTDVVIHVGDEVRLYRQTAGGRLARPVRYHADYAGKPVVLDLDRDGRLDVVDVGEEGGVNALLNRGVAARARIGLLGGRVPYIRADRTLRVPVRCSAGVSGCRGSVRIGRRRAYFDLLPRQRDSLALRFRRPPGRRLTAVARDELGGFRAGLTTHAATSAERAAGCSPPRSTTLAASAAARVFAFAWDILQTSPVGCLRSRGGWVGLPVAGFDGPVSTAGRWVAWKEHRCGDGDVCDEAIRRFDLRTRRSLTTLDLLSHAGCENGSRSCGAVAVGSIVVNRRGALAWIACTDSRFEDDCGARREARFSVFTLDARGKRRVDDGRTVRPGSLRLRAGGRSIAWRRAGGERLARLHGAAGPSPRRPQP